MSDLAAELGWQEHANCLGVDPELFFPERGVSTREAKEVCRGCVVRELCLEYALANGEKFGIWGGASERERRRIRRQRGRNRSPMADWIVELDGQGFTAQQIVKRTGASLPYVYAMRRGRVS